MVESDRDKFTSSAHRQIFECNLKRSYRARGSTSINRVNMCVSNKFPKLRSLIIYSRIDIAWIRIGKFVTRQRSWKK